jgi:hypothetical protein
VRDTEALRRNHRGELGALAHHDVGTPLLDRGEHPRQRGPGVQVDVQPGEGARHRLHRRQAILAGAEAKNILMRRLGHGTEAQPCALRQRRRSRVADDDDVVTGPLTSVRERHERAEMARRAGAGK